MVLPLEIICIFCSQRKKPTKEHLIPKSLGGNLIIYHVCEECNSLLGSLADSEFDANSYIAAAYKGLGWQDKLAEIIGKAEVTAFDMNLLISLRLRKKGERGFQIIPRALEDGSLIVGEDEVSAVINRIIDRRKQEYFGKGLTEEEIELNKKQLIRDHLDADPNTEVDFPALGFRLIKHSSELEEKVEFSKRIPLRGISKIGYELLFLVIGHRCLEERFDRFRTYAIGGNMTPPIWQMFPPEREFSFSSIHQLYLIEENRSIICGIKLFRDLN